MTKQRRVILVGAGSSIKEGMSLDLWEHLKDEEIWSCNYAFMAMPYLPSREIWVDIAFWKDNKKALEELNGKGVKMFSRVHNLWKAIDSITVFNSTREEKQENDNTLYYGRMGLSGSFALALAIHEKIPEIYLLGYDFGNNSLDNTQTHFYQDKLDVKSVGMGRPEVYRMKDNKVKREVKDFKYYIKEGIKIYNVSLESNISFFEKISYKDFFGRLSCQNG